MKTAVTLTFRAGTSPERRQAVLAEIERLPGIARAGLLKPESSHPELSRIAYVYLERDANLEAVLKQLRALPEVEAASAPAQRKLIQSN